jgi:hypothetical protein
VTALAPTLQAFFIDRLVGQRAASPNTIAAYRTSLLLLVRFASEQTGKKPNQLDIADLDAALVAAFLEHLESDRHNSPRTRNNRLAAIHSLFAYAALRHPEHAASIQRVLAIPAKRFQRNLVTYLTDAEVDALLAACDPNTWTGRRDHAMLALDVQTGLRISELAALTCSDVTLGPGANVHTIGKGRKERRTDSAWVCWRLARLGARVGAGPDPAESLADRQGPRGLGVTGLGLSEPPARRSGDTAPRGRSDDRTGGSPRSGGSRGSGPRKPGTRRPCRLVRQPLAGWERPRRDGLASWPACKQPSRSVAGRTGRRGWCTRRRRPLDLS